MAWLKHEAMALKRLQGGFCLGEGNSNGSSCRTGPTSMAKRQSDLSCIAVS